MAPQLKTMTHCICDNEYLDGKTMEKLVEEGLESTTNPRFYEVKVRGRKVSFKPKQRRQPKIKSFKFKKVTELYSDPHSRTVALTLEHKKRNPTCLALRFRNEDARRKFQSLVLEGNPKIVSTMASRPSKTNRTNTSVMLTTASSAENRYPVHNTPDHQKSVHHPRSPDNTPPRHRHHRHHHSQEPAERMVISRIEANPFREPRHNWSTSTEPDDHVGNRNSVFYQGQNGVTVKVNRPSYNSKFGYRKSSESPLRRDQGMLVEIRPLPRSKRSRSQPPKKSSAIYFYRDSENSESDEDWLDGEWSGTSYSESSGSYFDSSSLSARELGKPETIRLYRQ